MRHSYAPLIAIALLCMVSCSDRSPTQPQTLTVQARPHVGHPLPIPNPLFPALTRPGEIFYAPHGLYSYFNDYHVGELLSRFVLYSDSTFALQYWSPLFGSFAYGGRYYNAPHHCLAFDWNSADCGADAHRDGDRLDVQFTLSMQMNDFMNGVYIKAPH